jgi:formylglycine-generating enzyme required for sulfatase activity
MGCNEDKDPVCLCPGGDECAYHEVDVPAFLIDEFEVNVISYHECVLAGVCTKPGTGGLCTYVIPANAYYPVNCVTWQQASDFCAWDGGTGDYKPGGKQRLCTEAEWEKAARGTDGRIYPWGDKQPTCDDEAIMKDPLGGDGCGEGKPWTCGAKAGGIGPYGAQDLAGNVWEWVEDCYQNSYSGAPVDGTPRQSCAFASGANRVKRGGGFSDPAENLRASFRGFSGPDKALPDLGFRCCKTVETPAE